MKRSAQKAMHAKIHYKDVNGNTHEAKPKAFVTQTILFNQNNFTPEQARKWLRDHGKSDYLDIKKEKGSEQLPVMRARQVSPNKFQEGTLRTKQIEKGIEIVGGRLKQ